MFEIPEVTKPIMALAPAADAAGRTGAYISLKNVCCAYVIVNMTQGHAATVDLTIEQATAIAGTGSKAITNAVPIYANLATATNDTLVRKTDAVSFTTDAGVALKTVIFCIDPRKLDLANGFDCIVVKTGASNAANITSATYLVELGYQGANPPSVVVD